MDIIKFEQTIQSSKTPIVVDFWAPWCAPCRMTKPVLEKLAQEYAGQVTFLPINSDESGEVLARFKVMGIPTVIGLRNGQVALRMTGAQGEAQYRALFNALSTGEEVKIPIAPFDRALRLGAGLLLAGVGIATGTYWVVGVGALVAFFGVYDRCPVWAALTAWVKKRN